MTSRPGLCNDAARTNARTANWRPASAMLRANSNTSL
jgi:hypothetical protein